MNFLWLEDFLALAESGNFSRAADERHVTQPAFSRRIRALEEWLGVDLFDRGSQPAQLTEAGKWFRGAARDMLGRVSNLPGEARAVADANAATLRFAATHALSFSFMPGWLRSLEARVVVGPVRLVSDVLPRCAALLRSRQVQFVLSHAHAAAPDELHDFASVRVGTDALVPVSAPGAAGSARFSIDDGRRLRIPLLSYSSESGLGKILQAVQGQPTFGWPTDVAFTAHLASVLRTMALDGRGLAWLPWSLVEQDLAGGRLVESDTGRRVELEIRLYRDPSPLGGAGEEFWNATLKECAG